MSYGSLNLETVCDEKDGNCEKEVIKCENCGKFFIKSYGICPFCATEIPKEPETVVETNDDGTVTANIDEQTEKTHKIRCVECNEYCDVEFECCHNCGHLFEEKVITEETTNLKEEMKLNSLTEVSKNLLKYFQDTPFFNALLSISSVLVLMYPIYMFLQRFDFAYNISVELSSFSSIFKIFFYMGLILSFAKNQHKINGFAFGILALNRFVYIFQYTISEDLNDFVYLIFYIVMVACCVKLYSDSLDTKEKVQASMKNTATSQNTSDSKEISESTKRAITGAIIIAVIVFIVILIISNTHTCSECGKVITEGYSFLGKEYCKDCFM